MLWVISCSRLGNRSMLRWIIVLLSYSALDRNWATMSQNFSFSLLHLNCCCNFINWRYIATNMNLILGIRTLHAVSYWALWTCCFRGYSIHSTVFLRRWYIAMNLTLTMLKNVRSLLSAAIKHASLYKAIMISSIIWVLSGIPHPVFVLL